MAVELDSSNPDVMTTLSSPNRVVWEYFFSLRQLVKTANAASEESSRQAVALSVIMSVTVVEVFLNLWFRVLVESRFPEAQRNEFVKDLSYPRPASLDRKLKEWPKRYLGASLDFGSGPGAEFISLKRLRNHIVHFTSTHSTFEHENVIVRGLADTTEYDSLNGEKAAWALATAENLIETVFRLAAVPEEMIKHSMHAWVGKPPV